MPETCLAEVMLVLRWELEHLKIRVTQAPNWGRLWGRLDVLREGGTEYWAFQRQVHVTGWLTGA